MILDLASKHADIKKVYQAILETENSIRGTGNLLKKPESRGLEVDLEAKVRSQSEKLKKLKNNLSSIASGFDPEGFEGIDEDSQVDLPKEFQELLRPILNEIKRLTNRPRELDRLERRLTNLSEKSKKADLAIANLKSIISSNKDSEVATQLQEILGDWLELKTNLIAESTIAQQKLENIQGETSSFSDSIKEISDLFFKSRGRNLFLAIVATLGFWWSVRAMYARIKLSPVMLSVDWSLYRRLINLFYLFFSGSGSLIVFLFVLFLLGDWLLLILSLMILFGIAWTSKQAFPHFWAQGALLLNIGPVREGEKLIYCGVPWEVQSLNLYVTLKNPELDPQTIRVPLADFLSLRSREIDKHETWFPSQIGDWVLLSDGTHGRVVIQNQNEVVLVLLGGSRKTYSTAAYLSSNPQDLSTGFRIKNIIGFDYSHQDNLISDILSILKSEIVETLDSQLGNEYYRLSVELQGAAASSLDVVMILDADGKFGHQFETLNRVLQTAAVSACNKHKWIIPIPQLSVHLEK